MNAANMAQIGSPIYIPHVMAITIDARTFQNISQVSISSPRDEYRKIPPNVSPVTVQMKSIT